jgi:uncharacterized membrane protein
MPILDAITLFATLIMAGNELAVSAFVYPAIWKRDDQGLAGEIARSLGAFMPFWYGFCLMLLGSEAWLRRSQEGRGLLMSAVVLWIAIILYTVTKLVPLNNGLASMGTPTGTSDWKQVSKKWDRLHRARIVLLVVSIALFYAGLGG